jgi:hypothetical protein
MFLILLVEELEWTLKFQEKPSKRAWRIDYISVGNKELQLLLLLLGTEVLENF